AGKGLFLLDAQHRDLVHGADVGLQRPEGAGDRQVVGDELGGTDGLGHVWHLSNRWVGLLTPDLVPRHCGSGTTPVQEIARKTAAWHLPIRGAYCRCRAGAATGM